MSTVKSQLGFGWHFSTHSLITQQAAQDSSFNKDEINLLSKYSQKPDLEDWGSDYEDHYYNPETHSSYKPSDKNAKKIFISHTQNALKLFKTNKKESLEELGRACHFLEDMTCPYHITTKDFSKVSSPEYASYYVAHQTYELYSSVVQKFTEFNPADKKNSESKKSDNFNVFLEDLAEDTAVKTLELKENRNIFAAKNIDTQLNLAKDNTSVFLSRFLQEAQKG
jgi:hypothetical protein